MLQNIRSVTYLIIDWIESYWCLKLPLHHSLFMFLEGSWRLQCITSFCHISALVRLRFGCQLCIECSDGRMLQNTCNSHRLVPYRIPFASYLNLNADRKLRVEVQSSKTNIWDLICTCRRLAQWATFQAAPSSWCNDLSARLVSCNLALSGSHRWRGRLPEGHYRWRLHLFRAIQRTN